MALFPAPAEQVASRAVDDAVREASPWIRRLARLGYMAKGIVYVVVGALAAQAAVSRAEDPASSEVALRAIHDQPMGMAALGIVAVGLVGYVLWRLVQALLDPEGKGTGLKGIVVRLGYLLSGAIYAGLALEAVRLLRGTAGAGQGGNGRAVHWTAMVMEQPQGRWIVAAVGAGVILFGLFEIYRAAVGNLRKRMDLTRLQGPARDGVIRFGRAGLAARGVVFGILGWFLVQAALRYDPGQVKDLASALGVLRRQPYGPWLLGTTAVGLIAYGLWQIAKGRYRYIRPA